MPNQWRDVWSGGGAGSLRGRSGFESSAPMVSMSDSLPKGRSSEWGRFTASWRGRPGCKRGAIRRRRERPSAAEQPKEKGRRGKNGGRKIFNAENKEERRVC